MNFLWRLLPPRGRPFELFDCSILLFFLVFGGYVVSTPTPLQAEALSGPFLILPDWIWGSIVGAAALYGMVAAYFRRLVTSGYVVTIAASCFWAAIFLTSAVVSDAPPLRSLIVAGLYGWIARRLVREEDREFYVHLPSHQEVQMYVDELVQRQAEEETGSG